MRARLTYPVLSVLATVLIFNAFGASAQQERPAPQDEFEVADSAAQTDPTRLLDNLNTPLILFADTNLTPRVNVVGTTTTYIMRIVQQGTSGHNMLVQSFSNNTGTWNIQATQSGLGRNAIFETANTSNIQPSLEAKHDGLGRAGFFQNMSASNSVPALQAQHLGTGPALFGSTTGSGPAVWGRQVTGSGGGRAGLFEMTNTANTSAALETKHAGGSGNPAFRVTNGTLVFSSATVTTTVSAGGTIDDAYLVYTGASSSITLTTGSPVVSGQTMWLVNNSMLPTGTITVTNTSDTGTCGTGFTIPAGEAQQFLYISGVCASSWIPVQ